MASRFTTWAAALSIGLGLAACSRSGSELAASSEVAGEQQAGVGLLGLLANAPASVPFEGVRQFQAHWNVGGTPQHLIYTEQVFADGLGNFSLTTTDVTAPPMTASEEALFLMTQQLRARTLFQARDFGVRDEDLFAANYVLIDTGLSTTVAGTPCQRVIAEQRVAAERRFLLDVHTATGLILSSREELLDGSLVSQTRFVSIDFSPNLAGVTWNLPINDEESLEPGTIQAQNVLGYKPRLPKVLPQGWQQIEFAKVHDPVDDETWAKVVYSDGVEQIYYLFTPGDGPTKELKNPTGNPTPKHADRVSRMAVGHWTLLDADLQQGKALILGRTADGVLEDLLQSAMF